MSKIPPITSPITREQFEETARAILARWPVDVRDSCDPLTHVEYFIDFGVRNFHECVNASVIMSCQLAKPLRRYNRHTRRRMERNLRGAA